VRTVNNHAVDGDPAIQGMRPPVPSSQVKASRRARELQHLRGLIEDTPRRSSNSHSRRARHAQSRPYPRVMSVKVDLDQIVIIGVIMGIWR
jgi:hypothetical protein